MNLILRPCLILLLALATLAASGCARRQPPPAAQVRLAVIDGLPDPLLRDSRVATRGWWLGMNYRHDNANAGIHFADALADSFSAIPGVTVHPRTDVRALFAEKEHMLRRAYPDLTESERRLVLLEQDPVDFGRSLNADFVLASRVDKSRLTHKTTFNWWFGEAAGAVDLYDVRSGERVWSWEKRDRDWFASSVAVLRDLSRQARREAQKANALGTAAPRRR
jgi:hypothetical protein